MPDNNYPPISDDSIDDPAPLNAIKWDELDGRLVLITPHYTKEVPSLDGNAMREVVFARVVMLDGPGSPMIFDDTPIYPRYLVGQLRPGAGTGRSNLGRVGKDASRQRPNQSAPWVLARPTDAERQLARQYLAAHPAPPVVRNQGGTLSPGGTATTTSSSGTAQQQQQQQQLDVPPF